MQRSLEAIDHLLDVAWSKVVERAGEEPVRATIIEVKVGPDDFPVAVARYFDGKTFVDQELTYFTRKPVYVVGDSVVFDVGNRIPFVAIVNR